MPEIEEESARAQVNPPLPDWSDTVKMDSAVEAWQGTNGRTQRGPPLGAYTCTPIMRAWGQNRLPHTNRPRCWNLHRGALNAKRSSVLKGIIRNIQIVDRAMQTAWGARRPDTTETKIAECSCDCVAAQGAMPLFVSIGACANGGFQHDHIEGIKLCDCDCLVTNVAGGINRYSGYITRMGAVCFASGERSKAHAFAQACVKTALSPMTPGFKARGMVPSASYCLAEAGFGEYFICRTGHSLETETHEPSYFSASSEMLLAECMVLPIKPGKYPSGRFGIRPDEIVILPACGTEPTSDLPRV